MIIITASGYVDIQVLTLVFINHASPWPSPTIVLKRQCLSYRITVQLFGSLSAQTQQQPKMSFLPTSYCFLKKSQNTGICTCKHWPPEIRHSQLYLSQSFMLFNLRKNTYKSDMASAEITLTYPTLIAL